MQIRFPETSLSASDLLVVCHSVAEERALQAGAAAGIPARTHGGVPDGGPSGQEEPRPGDGQAAHPHDEGTH